MTKLEVIRTALQLNPDVVIVDEVEKNYLPEKDGFWSHTIDFLVAPREGLYTVSKLDEFMLELVPQLEPSAVDYFSQHDSKDHLHFGKLYFDEEIGEVKTTKIITLTDMNLKGHVEIFPDKDPINEYSFDDKGNLVIEGVEDLRRRTWVNVYPCEDFVKDLIAGKLKYQEYETDVSTLNEYRPNLMTRATKGLVRLLTN